MGTWALCVGVWPAWPLTRRLSQLKCLDVPFRWVKDRHWDGNRDAFLRINGGKWPKIPEIAAAWVFGRCPRGSTPAFSAAFKCVCAMSKWENERPGSYALLLIQRGAFGGPFYKLVTPWRHWPGCGPPDTHLSVSPPCPALPPQGRAGSLHANPGDPDVLGSPVGWASAQSCHLPEAWKHIHPWAKPLLHGAVGAPQTRPCVCPCVFCSELGPFRTEFALIISHSKRSCLPFVGSSFPTGRLTRLCPRQCPWLSRGPCR